MTTSKVVDKQKTTGTTAVIMDTVGDVVNHALSTATILGSGWMIMVVVIVLAIPYFIYKLLNSSGGQQALNTAATTATTIAGNQPKPMQGIPLKFHK